MPTRLVLSIAVASLLVVAVRPAAANSIGGSHRGDGPTRGDLAWQGHSGHHSVSAFGGSHDFGGWIDDDETGDAKDCASKRHGDPTCSNDGEDHEWAENESGHDGWHFDGDFGEGELHHGKNDCNPVPEPGTMLLLALGLTGLARVEKR